MLVSSLKINGVDDDDDDGDDDDDDGGRDVKVMLHKVVVSR